MKKALLILLLACTATVAAAQQGTVTATLVDADTEEGVAGAVVEVAPVKSPEKKKYFTSGYKGSLSMAGLAYGEYTATFSFIGYRSETRTFAVNGAKRTLGRIELAPEATQIVAVVKEAKALRASQKGDTVSYNAGAFKVTTDSDVEGLLKKMPGISVSNGTVEAQGEEVKKVYVDGKEFFGEDVSTAIKSLPAEAVDRIEVYNKLSDNAEFSGMDDGEGYKAINIVTHENMRRGQFGKLYAMGGYDADTRTESRFKYNAGGNVNIFNGDSRLSVLALFNNVNQQNFSFEDILGVTGGTGGGPGGGRGAWQYMTRPQSGVARVNAIGLNYSDTWGKRDQVTFQGSYFFNGTNTTNRSSLVKWYEYPAIDTLSTSGLSETENYNHRLNARIEWKISENQNLMIRPNFSYQSNDPLSTTTGWQLGESGYSYTNTLSDASSGGYNARLSAVYRAKLGKTGRTITVDGSARYRDLTGTSRTASNTAPLSPVRPVFGPDGSVADLDDYLLMRYLYNDTPSHNYTLKGNITYTEPVSKFAQVSAQYRASYEYQERDKRSYITSDDFDPTGITPAPELSNSYRSGYMIHRAGPGFRYAKERNTLVANVYYQHSSLDGQVERANSEKISHGYDDITYFLMGQFNINRENSIRLFVRSYTQNPSITDLQSVYDVSDAQYISSGNPELNPSYSHNVMFHYINSNLEKGRTFMWMFSLQNTSDYITPDVAYNGSVQIDGTQYNYLQYSRPVNMDGYWSVRTHLSYGLPVSFIRSNFNVMGGVVYTRTPGRIDGRRNLTDNMGYDLRAVLGSNISENVDFTLAWNGTYNVARNSLAASGNNKYFNHTAEGNLKVVFGKGFTFTASAAYAQYKGITNDYDDSYLLCNASIGKKLFRNRRGEISIGVNDLFNQNTAFVRTTGSGWTQNARNSVIGRYYMVTFTYNLRRFGKNATTNLAEYGGMSESGSQRRMGPGGPPPGGFHGPHF